MIDWKLISRLIWPDVPKFPNSVTDEFEELFPESLTLGTVYIGRQGTGKTSALARHVVDYFEKFPNRAIFVLDWSGSISDTILKIILQRPKEVRERLLKRIVYDELGNPEWVIPLPEFSERYNSPYEKQVQRVAKNLVRLSDVLVKGAPYLAGLGLREIAPQAFRLLTAITNEYGETWQVTETKKLLLEDVLLKNAVANYGDKNSSAKYFFDSYYRRLSTSEKDMRIYSIIGMLGAVEEVTAKARVGYYRPGWTPGEAISKGLLVLIDSARLIDQENTQHYLFSQAYSLIMAEIDKRRPDNPDDEPVLLVLDEVYSVISIPGMSEELAKLSPQYRNRKLNPHVAFQSLSQLAQPLDKQIWSFGNIVCFALSNHNEAYEMAQQLFKYEPQTLKLPARSDTSQPIIEPDRGQYLMIADTIQRMEDRECIVRRFKDEKVMDKYIRYIPRTKDYPTGELEESVAEVRERLVQERGVRVRDALEVINQRNMDIAGRQYTKPPNVRG